MVELYREYEETLSRVSAEDDLRWYSVKLGADMPYNWPEFEVSMNLKDHLHLSATCVICARLHCVWYK